MIYRLFFFGCMLFLAAELFGQERWQVKLDVTAKVKIKAAESKGWKVYSRPTRISFLKNISVKGDSCEVHFTPESNGSALLSLRAETGFGVIASPWIVIRGLSAEGVDLKNAGFDLLNKKKVFQNWLSSPANVVTNPPGARVSYEASVSQRIALRKGVPVTLRFQAKLEPSLKEPFPPGSNVVTDEVTNIPVLVSTGRIAFRPTFENCGVYINRKPEEYGKNLQLKMYYRKVGSEHWNQALDPVAIPLENSWRGSIMMLKENTKYEVKCEISGDLSRQITGSFVTRNSNVKIARTIELDPASFSGSLKIRESGKPDGYIRYTMKPGGVLKGNASGQAVIDLQHVSCIILENLTIDCNRTPGGIRILRSKDIQVRNCNIYNFGRIGKQRLDLDGKFYIGNKQVYYDPGIEIKNSADVLVERSFIHNPACTSNTWFYSHPAGPSALRVETNEGVVLRYNDLVGSDKSRFIDVIHAPINSHMTGGFMRDADIYGNLFIFSNDDAIEMEGGGMNCRFYLNRVEGTYTGVSTGACRLGPIYQYRNLYSRPGDEEHRYGLPFKNGLSVQGYGAIFFINNTVANQRPRLTCGGFHRKPPRQEYKDAFKALSRNNIVSSKNICFDDKIFRWKVDFDYDLIKVFSPGDPAVQKEIFARHKQGEHTLFAAPAYVDAANGDFRLAPGSPGYGQAARLPNLTCTNMGAFQDDGIHFLPYRALPLDPSRQEIYFSTSKSVPQQTFSVKVKGKGYAEPFTAYCNDDFFSVEPKSGVFRSGSEQKFTVTLNPNRMLDPRRYNGVVLLRTGQGLSLPVTVYADYRDDKGRREKALKSAMVIPVDMSREHPEAKVEVDIPEDGVYFLFIKAENIRLVKDIRVHIGHEDTGHRARVLGLGMRNEKVEYFPITKGYLSAYYFKLKAGRQQLSVKMDFSGENEHGKITSLLLTRTPKLFVW